MTKQDPKSAAVIDIGSSGVRMLVAQWDGRRVAPLDYLEKPIGLGQEVFQSGVLSFETVRELSTILAGFCTVAQEYGVKIQATATTALREAANRAYILDHLAIQNKLQVRVLEDNETGALQFHHLRHELRRDTGQVLMVYGGTGTVDFALVKGGETVNHMSMHTGLLKIVDLMQEASEYSLRVDLVAREFLHTFMERQYRVQDLRQVTKLLFSMGVVRPLFAICGVDPQKTSATLSKKDIVTAIDSCQEHSFQQMAQEYGVSDQDAGIAYGALILLDMLQRSTGIKKVRCVQSELAEAAVDMLLRPGSRRAYSESMRAGAIASAQNLCLRYRCNLDHARHVAAIAGTLFEKLRKIHGLSRRHSTLLQIACILHELGQFTNAVDAQEATFHLVKDVQILGLSAEETLLTANIIAPQSLLGIERGSPRTGRIPEQDELMAAKMHALMHLSDALDYARRQKAELKEIRREAQTLTLSMLVREDYTLEKLMFRQSAVLFREIFGMTPCLEMETMRGMKGIV